MKGLKTTFAVLMLGAVIALPARADGDDTGGDAGISFGYDDALTGFAPCDYYRYYEKAPPWGLPDDYCDDLVSFDPVYYDGFWYRGPIYHRRHHGKDEVWLHGGWRENAAQRPRPPEIVWQDRGGPTRGFRGDVHPGRDGEAIHVDAGRGGTDAHGGGAPSIHGGDAPSVHAGGETPSVHGGDAPSVHASAPSSSESHGSSSSSGGGVHR